MKSALISVLAVVAAMPTPGRADERPPSIFFDAVGSGAGDRPGCAVALIRGGGVTDVRRFGLAIMETGAGIGPETRFNIASMSKQFTGAAVALLIADGVLSEDDSVRRHIPELPERFGGLTVRHLLGHQSGLRNHMALIAFSAPEEVLGHAETVALVLRQSAANAEPGVEYQYASPSYVLLAEVVARASGMLFEEFLRLRVFQPLGMSSTGFDEAGTAPSYNAGSGGYTPARITNRARGSSGVVTTVEDLARWTPVMRGAALGGRDISGALRSYSRLGSGERVPYNYGLAKAEDAFGVSGLFRLSHAGSTAGYRSTLSYFPDQDIGAAALCNGSDAPLPRIEAGLRQWLGPEESAPATQAAQDDAPVSAPAAPAMTEGQARRLAGAYHDAAADEVHELVVENGALALRYMGQAYPLSPEADGALSVGPFRFTFEDGPEGPVLVQAEEAGARRFRRVAAPEDRSDAVLGLYRSPDVNGPVHVRRSADGGLILETLRQTGALRAVGRDLYTDDGDFAVIRFTPEDGGMTITTHSGIRKLAFRREAGG